MSLHVCEGVKIAEIAIRSEVLYVMILLSSFLCSDIIICTLILYLCPFMCRTGMHILADLVGKISASMSVKVR